MNLTQPTKRIRFLDIATRLEAIGHYQIDQAACRTTTGELFIDAAEALRDAAQHICDQGHYWADAIDRG